MEKEHRPAFPTVSTALTCGLKACEYPFTPPEHTGMLALI